MEDQKEEMMNEDVPTTKPISMYDLAKVKATEGHQFPIYSEPLAPPRPFLVRSLDRKTIKVNPTPKPNLKIRFDEDILVKEIEDRHTMRALEEEDEDEDMDEYGVEIVDGDEERADFFLEVVDGEIFYVFETEDDSSEEDDDDSDSDDDCDYESETETGEQGIQLPIHDMLAPNLYNTPEFMDSEMDLAELSEAPKKPERSASISESGHESSGRLLSSDEMLFDVDGDDEDGEGEISGNSFGVLEESNIRDTSETDLRMDPADDNNDVKQEQQVVTADEIAEALGDQVAAMESNQEQKLTDNAVQEKAPAPAVAIEDQKEEEVETPAPITTEIETTSPPEEAQDVQTGKPVVAEPPKETAPTQQQAPAETLSAEAEPTRPQEEVTAAVLDKAVDTKPTDTKPNASPAELVGPSTPPTKMKATIQSQNSPARSPGKSPKKKSILKSNAPSPKVNKPVVKKAKKPKEQKEQKEPKEKTYTKTYVRANDFDGEHRVYTWEKPTWTNAQLKSTGKGEEIRKGGNLASPITFPKKKSEPLIAEDELATMTAEQILKRLMGSDGGPPLAPFPGYWRNQRKLKLSMNGAKIKSGSSLEKPITMATVNKKPEDALNPVANPNVLKNRGVRSVKKTYSWEKPEWAAGRKLRGTNQGEGASREAEPGVKRTVSSDIIVNSSGVEEKKPVWSAKKVQPGNSHDEESTTETRPSANEAAQGVGRMVNAETSVKNGDSAGEKKPAWATKRTWPPRNQDEGKSEAEADCAPTFNSGDFHAETASATSSTDSQNEEKKPIWATKRQTLRRYASDGNTAGFQRASSGDSFSNPSDATASSDGAQNSEKKPAWATRKKTLGKSSSEDSNGPDTAEGVGRSRSGDGLMMMGSAQRRQQHFDEDGNRKPVGRSHSLRQTGRGDVLLSRSHAEIQKSYEWEKPEWAKRKFNKAESIEEEKPGFESPVNTKGKLGRQ